MNQLLIFATDHTLISIIRDTLKTTPVDFILVESAQKAAQVIKGSSRPDMVLLDLSVDQALPFLKEMKAHEKYNDLPVLAMLEEPDSEQIKLALEAGADRWLTTGFLRNTLVSVMRQLMGKVPEN